MQTREIRHRRTVQNSVAVAVMLLSSIGSGLGAQMVALTPANPQTDPAAMVKQGQQLDRDGKHADAQAIYQKALAASPNFFPAQLALGQSFDLTSQYKDARHYFDLAIADAPPENKAQALRSMAVSYAFAGDANGAAKFEQQAMDVQTAAHNPSGAAEAADELARICLELGNPKAAMKWYSAGHQWVTQMADASDSAKDLWEFRWEHAQARIAAREGHKDEAVNHMNAAKAVLDRGHIAFQARFFPYLAGYVAFYNGDMQGAITNLQAADQQDPFILCLLGQAYEKSGDKTQAIDYYKKALMSNSHSPTNAFARLVAPKRLAGLS